jgi:hypothetical protein
MPLTRKEIIQKKAVEILDANPKGIRYSELVARIADALPDIPKNTVHGNVWKLDVLLPAQVYKPARGVWKSTKYREPADTTEEVVVAPPPPEVTLKEEQFYEPFADWITSELEECTKAIALGGNRFKDKWGTPDVIWYSGTEKERHHQTRYRDHFGGAENRSDWTNRCIWSGLRVQTLLAQVLYCCALTIPGGRHRSIGCPLSYLRSRTDSV